jgi:hypothetical protein
MLASPGVDLRRDDVSSVTHVSSLGFFNADGVPAIRPAVMPPVNVGRPAAPDGHATGVVFVGFNDALIGYVSFDIAFSLIIAVELPVVVFRAERADGGRGVGPV